MTKNVVLIFSFKEQTAHNKRLFINNQEIRIYQYKFQQSSQIGEDSIPYVMAQNNNHNFNVLNNNYQANFGTNINTMYQNSPFNPQYANVNGLQNFSPNNNFNMPNNQDQHYNNYQQTQPMYNQSMPVNGYSNYNYNPQMQNPQQQSQFSLIYPQKIQPYNDKDFLCKTFNFKVQYIRAFLTLSHQEKLCFFMFVQQKRLTRRIQKESEYKQLLNKIADIVNPTRKITQQQVFTEQEIRQKTLQGKVNQFCDEEFKRLDVKLHKQDDQQEFNQFTQAKQEDQFNQFQDAKTQQIAKKPEKQQQWKQGIGQIQSANHSQNGAQNQYHYKQYAGRGALNQNWKQNQNQQNNEKRNYQQDMKHQNVQIFQKEEEQQEWGWTDNNQSMNHENHFQSKQVITQNQNKGTQAPTYSQTFTNNLNYQSFNGDGGNFDSNFISNFYQSQPTQVSKVDDQIRQINVDKYVIKSGSIWDLQLNQEELKNSQPSIREIFGGPGYQQQNTQPINSANKGGQVADLFDFIGTSPVSDEISHNMLRENGINLNGNQNSHQNHTNGSTGMNMDDLIFGDPLPYHSRPQNLHSDSNKMMQNNINLINGQKHSQQEEEWQQAEQVQEQQTQVYFQPYPYPLQQKNIQIDQGTNPSYFIHENFVHQQPKSQNHIQEKMNQQFFFQQDQQQWVESESPQVRQKQTYDTQPHIYNGCGQPENEYNPFSSPNKQKSTLQYEKSQQESNSYQFDQKTLTYSNHMIRHKNQDSVQNEANNSVIQNNYSSYNNYHANHSSQNNYSKNMFPNDIIEDNHENKFKLPQNTYDYNQKQSSYGEQPSTQPKKNQQHDDDNDEDQFYQASYQHSQPTGIFQPLQKPIQRQQHKKAYSPANQQKNQYDQTKSQNAFSFAQQDKHSYFHDPINLDQPAMNGLKKSGFSNNSQVFSQQSFQDLPEVDSKYLVIEPLKIKLQNQELNYLNKKIKSDAFQCEAQFYENIIKYLEKFNFQFETEGSNSANMNFLSMSHQGGKCVQKQKIIINLKQSDIRFLQNQKKIVEKIHELTVKYTNAVQLDEEQLVIKTIKQSKQFYQVLSNNTIQTKTIVKNILQSQQHKNKELSVKQAGIFYSLARLNLDTGVKEQYIQKLVTNYKRDGTNQTKNTFISQSLMLFLLQKMNQVNYLKNITQTICTYLLDQYQKYQATSQKIQEISKETNTPPYLLNQKVFKQQGYLAYLKGLIRIAITCQRLLLLTKLTSFKLQINLIKTSKIIKQLKNLQLKNSSLFVEPQPMLYQQYTSRILSQVQQNRSVYELHSVLMELMRKSSICKICLGKSQQQLKGDFRDENAYSWCHYSCYNLLIKAFQSKS